jgi:hypothetical protein
MEINIKSNNMNIEIKLNEGIMSSCTTTMNQSQNQTFQDYYKMYVQQEMSKGISEFHASVKFLMDEAVPQKYKDLYRKKQNQSVEAMDLDEYPEPPKLKRF